MEEEEEDPIFLFELITKLRTPNVPLRIPLPSTWLARNE